MQVRDAAQHQSRIKFFRHRFPPRRRPRPESPCISRMHADPSYPFYSEDDSTANAKRDPATPSRNSATDSTVHKKLAWAYRAALSKYYSAGRGREREHEQATKQNGQAS